MKKLFTLLTSLNILSLPVVSLISCDNYQTKDENLSKLLNNTSKKQTKNKDVTSNNDNEKINDTTDEKTDIQTNNNVEDKKNDTSIKSLDNSLDEFDAFKKPKNELNNKINTEEVNNKKLENNEVKDNKVDTSNKSETINNKNENSTSEQITNANETSDKTKHDSEQNNVKEKTWLEKLNEEDPQYLKLINFIEMVGNSTKQLLVGKKYNRLPKYKELAKMKFWEFFWSSFKTELLKANTTTKQLYNEIFDDAILQNTNSNTNECTYILKSNNFISFTFGYDKRNCNFYFISQHPKYGKIDSKTADNIFKKKYELINCTITSEDNVDLF